MPTTTDRAPQKMYFIKQHILPVLMVFVIPAFSAWFFSYAERKIDASYLKGITRSIESNPRLSPEKRAEILEFYHHFPPSRILASNDPEMAEVQENFKESKMDYATFRWMRRIAWVCLGTIAATFILVGLSVAYSFRSHAAQYRALRLGWPILQLSAAIQVLGQGLLAVALSYWVTAIFFEVYAVKLILIAGLLAVVGVWALLKAIFAKVDDRHEVTGEIVTDTDAPRLWEHVRRMAGKLGTTAPDQIFVGIEPSFFVTEHPVTVGEKVHHGRTLYLSLPMLKVMSTDEADAVLGHELAHFSGEDTLWSRKISPLTGKFLLYLELLYKGASVPVAHFMAFFWKLYGLSIRKLSRQREFRADGVGAELVSKDAMKRALIKTTCYCEYRDKVESNVLEQRRVDTDLDLSARLESGYPAFLSSFAQSDEAINERVPHPFDSHPTLHNRLAQLGFEAQTALRDESVQQPVADSWYAAINTAPTLEERLWNQRQTLLQTFHDEQLAWRLLPEGEEETAQVLKHFPHVDFRAKDGRQASLDYDRIQYADWPAPIFFRDIDTLKLEDSWGKKLLTITHRKADQPKPVKSKCHPVLFTGPEGTLLDVFGKYYNRHQSAQAANTENKA